MIQFRAHFLLLLLIVLLALHYSRILFRLKVLGILVNFLVVLVLSHIYVVLADRAENLSLVLGTQLLGTDPCLNGGHLVSLLLKSDVWRLRPPDHHHAGGRGIISQEIFGLQVCLNLPDRV